MSEEGFFSRWARRKQEVRSGQAAEETPAAAGAPASAGPQAGGPAAVPPAGAAARGAAPEGAGAAAPAAEAEPPLPSMDDVARLTRDSDYSGFMRRGVDADVRRAAMKKLFTDPHYNVMDGLDIYIDDYSKPDPIPMAMLRKMKQSQLLGLFRDEEAAPDAAQAFEAAPAVADATPAAAATDDSGAAAVAQSRADGAAGAHEPAADAGVAAAPQDPDDERVAAAGDAPRDRPGDDGAAPPAGPPGPAGRS